MWSSLLTTNTPCCRSEIFRRNVVRTSAMKKYKMSLSEIGHPSFLQNELDSDPYLRCLMEQMSMTLPSGWHMQNGSQKWYGSCGRSSAQVNFSWRTGNKFMTGWFEICPQSLRGAWTARSWCFSHASDNYRQHQRPCHHDRRENGRHVTQGLGSIRRLGSIKLFSQRQDLQFLAVCLSLVLQWGSSWLGQTIYLQLIHL